MTSPATFGFIFACFGAMISSSCVSAQGLKDDSLQIILASAQPDSSKANKLFEIGRDYWFSRNFAEASYYLKTAVLLADRSGFRKNQADAYNLLANVALNQEDFDATSVYLQQALAQNDEKFAPLISETYSRLYIQLGDYPSALRHALRAAEGYERNPDPDFNMLSVFAYVIAGDILSKQGQDGRAFDYYQRAYQKARSARVNWYIKTPLQKVAHYHFVKNDLARAKHLYDSIITIDVDAPSHEPTMYSYEGLGHCAMKEGDFAHAIRYYRKALAYAKEKALSLNEETFYTRLGAAFVADGRHDSAKHYLGLAIAHSAENRNYANLSQAYRHLSLIEQKEKNFEQALKSYTLYKEFQDSVLNIEKVRSVNNLEILYQTRQKENEILRLQKSDEEKDFAIRERNLYIAIAAGMLVALATILLLLRNNLKNRQHLHDERLKQMEQQQQVLSLQAMLNGEETERIRIAKDLHDGLGGLFSTVKMHFSALQHKIPGLRTDELFQKSLTLADQASVEVRNVAHNMMPEVLMKLGLLNAVRDLSNNMSSGRRLKVSVESYGLDNRLPSPTEIILYRIIQELLNNIIKHADATEAIIQFTRDRDRLSVVVEDNGKGFDPVEAQERANSGLRNIRSRVDYLNGTLIIDSQRNVGTTVLMDFEIHDPAKKYSHNPEKAP